MRAGEKNMSVRRLNPETMHRIPDRISQIAVIGSLAFVSGQVAWDAQIALRRDDGLSQEGSDATRAPEPIN
jgi:hypothetical protein